jgi:hypothetical protein
MPGMIGQIPPTVSNAFSRNAGGCNEFKLNHRSPERAKENSQGKRIANERHLGLTRYKLREVFGKVSYETGCRDVLVIGVDADEKGYPYQFIALAFGIEEQPKKTESTPK